ncbi:hypothetical protein RCL1_008214 [Eukaryota sp. TZLM3-RCL]
MSFQQKTYLYQSPACPQVFESIPQRNGKDGWVALANVSGKCQMKIARIANQFVYEFSPPSAPHTSLMYAPVDSSFFQTPGNLEIRDPQRSKRYWVRFLDATQDQAIYSIVVQAQAAAKGMLPQQQHPQQFPQHPQQIPSQFPSQAAPHAFTPNQGHVNPHQNQHQQNFAHVSGNKVAHNADYIALEIRTSSAATGSDVSSLPSDFKHDVASAQFNHDFSVEQRLVTQMYQRRDILKNARLARSVARKEGQGKVVQPVAQVVRTGNPIKDQLLDMGFPLEKVEAALIASNGNQSGALSALLNGAC